MTESSSSDRRIRVLLADDEASIRAGLRLVLRHAEDIEVVAEAGDGAQAITLAAEHRVDVALVDIRMPVMDGLAAIEHLVALTPKPEVVMLTTFGEEENVTRALRAGASGFLLKDDSPGELINAVRAAAVGDAVLSPRVTAIVVQRMLAGESAGGNPGANAGENGAAGAERNGRPTAAQRIAGLTDTERQVLAMLGVGMPNIEIALQLGIGVDDAKALTGSIMAKTDSDSRVQAALLAAQAGLVTV